MNTCDHGIPKSKRPEDACPICKLEGKLADKISAVRGRKTREPKKDEIEAVALRSYDNFSKYSAQKILDLQQQLTEKDEENKQLMSIAEDWQRQYVQAESVIREKDATIKELEQQVKKWKSLAESKVTHVHYNDNEHLRKALKFAGWDIKQKMETKTIKTPSWVLLEALGHVDCELVDIDLEGGMVKITTVKGDKE